VAVSTGLLQSMSEQEVEAVLAHGVAYWQGRYGNTDAHSGVVNTFVFFLARVVGYLMNSAMSRGSNEKSSGHGMGYMIVYSNL
jgi:heat shock protein HtpX